MQDLIALVRTGAPLAPEHVAAAAEALLAGEIAPETKAAFLKELARKGETADEVAGFVEAFLHHAVDPGIDPARLPGPSIDVCGTGGDRLELFNISTATMFVVAAAGAAVLKHGNRGVTSKCGGADVLEALGVRIDLPPDTLRECAQRTGLCFLFAQQYHPAFKAVAPARKLLAQEKVTTIFNMLGPLLNPARPKFQLVGVFAPKLLEVYPQVFGRIGREAAWVVHGDSPQGPMDEISTLGPTRAAKFHAGTISEETIEPSILGFVAPERCELAGGDATANAAHILAILEGADRGPKRDIVVLNAAAALCVCGLVSDLASGIQLAGERIDDGTAKAKLAALRAFA